jgi:hypothetical protein
MSLVPGPRCWTAEYAARVLHDFECSQLSLTAFARQRGLHVERLRRWRVRLQPKSPMPRVIELISQAPATLSGTRGIRVTCPSGHVVEVSGVEPVAALAATLYALRNVEC